MNRKNVIVEKLLWMTVLDYIPKKKPGALIERLSQEDREVVQSLTSKDFNHRIEKGLFVPDEEYKRYTSTRPIK